MLSHIVNKSFRYISCGINVKLKSIKERNILIPIDNSWSPIIKEATATDSYAKLRQFLVNEYNNQTIYPDMYDIWTAFQWTPYDKVKVVILGQDPYHGAGQAHGLSFSVKPGVDIPPSLRNIYTELENDLGIKPVNHGYLEKWAKQGVLMLNSVLTVRAGQANSHRGKGWEEVTDFAIKALNAKETPVVFLLWGNSAIQKSQLIDQSKHAIITSSHPSPFSAHISFLGSRPFSKANKILIASGQSPIDWALPQNPLES